MGRTTLTAVTLLPLLGALPRASAAAPQPLVIVDAAHGGTSSGAYGPAAGVLEKTLTLAVALATARELRARGLRVVLTRTDDRQLSLEQRAALANRHDDAAAFVSIHFNASPTQTRAGFEVRALERAAEAPATQQLALNVGALDSAPSEAPFLTAEENAIIVELMHRAQFGTSTQLAETVREPLRALRGAHRDGGLELAPFDVATALRMPGVLVELGHIDHPREGPELADPQTQRQLAAALAAGLERFVSSR